MDSIEVSQITNLVSFGVTPINKIIDLNVSQTSKSVNFDVTPNMITLNVNQVIGGGEVNSVNGQIGDVIITTLEQNKLVFGETPNGLVNGSNVTFTTAFNFVSGTLELFLNGVFQKIINDYQLIGNNTITLNTSPIFGENILINYIKL